jgi:hypothetical protein
VAALPRAGIGALLESWPGELAALTVVGRLRAGAGVDVLDREGGLPTPRPRTSSRHFS